MQKTLTENTTPRHLLLIEARTAKQLSLTEISKTTRIPEKFLNQFESEAPLVKDAYTTIYLKAYCKYLGIEPIKNEEQNKATPQTTATTQPVTQLQHPKPSLHIFETLPVAKILRGLSITAVILSGLGYFSYLLYAMVAAPKLTLLTPATNITTNNPELQIKGITEQGTTVTIEGKTIAIDDQGQFTDNVDLITGMNTITISAKKKYSKPTTITREIVVTP
jgi:cytoskeletal protein RodZ